MVIIIFGLPLTYAYATLRQSVAEKSQLHFCIIPWYSISYLTIAGYGFFLGAYGSLPDAAICLCLRTGGGGVLTSNRVCCDDLYIIRLIFSKPDIEIPGGSEKKNWTDRA